MLAISNKFNSSSSSNPPKITTNFENPTLHITTKKLNGENFSSWSQSTKLFMKSKGKMKDVLGISKAQRIRPQVQKIQWSCHSS